MTEKEIIEQCMQYFSEDSPLKKDLLTTYDIEKNYSEWTKNIQKISSYPGTIKCNINNDVIALIENKEIDKINWDSIGDLSWTLEIILNPNITKSYDWDKKLALKCGGTVRILKIYISITVPCYTFDCYYMTYSKEANYYEFGAISHFSKTEKKLLNDIRALFAAKNIQDLGKRFYEKQFKELYSDTNSDGNASLFEVLFSDTDFFQGETTRHCDKDIIEKNGTKFRWREYYNKNGKLKERIESRSTCSGDYFNVVLDIKGQIKKIEVIRKENKTYPHFQLDINKELGKRNKNAKSRRKEWN